MRIGIASPLDLAPLAPHLDNWVDTPEGWAFPYITTLALALLDRGHDVHIFGLNDNITDHRTFTGPGLVVDVLPMRPNGRDRVRDLYRTERQLLADAMRASSCDVVHAHWTYEFGAAAVQSGLPNVVTAHDSPWVIVGEARHLTIATGGRAKAPSMFRNARRTVIRSLLAEYVVRNAGVVTAVSPNVARDMERQFFPRQPVRMIPNGLPAEGHRPREKVRDPRAPVFGFVSNGFGDRKNTVGALRAIQLVRQQIPGARLLLIGREHEAAGEAQQWASARGLDDGCSWLGTLPNAETLRLMRDHIDVLVHPSYWEACSIAIMEAQALGLPVVGGRTSGGVSYSLQGGAAGLLVDVDDPGDIAAAMLQLASHDHTYAALSAGGIRAVRDTFTLERVAAQYEVAFGDALKVAAQR